MTPYIPDHERSKLDVVVVELMEVLRELECDHTDLYDTTDNRLMYFLNVVLNKLYTNSITSHNAAIGVLENSKQLFHAQQIATKQIQSMYDNTIDEPT